MKLFALAFIALLSSNSFFNHGALTNNIAMCRCGCGK